MNTIPFSPPDIDESDVQAVLEVLRSGWITTGPQTAAFEQELSQLCGTRRTVALNSATAALELSLRALGIGEGDEVITTAYTYTASASVVEHVGARIVLVDTLPGSFDMDPDAVAAAITDRTKAIVAVDLAGVVYDHGRLLDIAEEAAERFVPSSPLQEALGRVAVIADAAHSLGARGEAGRSGSIADFSSFSFHAVKNLTTGEGGALTWRADLDLDHDDLYRSVRRNSLHGQTKDALAKTGAAAWEYDIVNPGYKANMTDIAAALGRSQLARYDAMLDHRHRIIDIYDAELDERVSPRRHRGEGWRSSGHLYMTTMPVTSVERRNAMIEELAAQGVSTNVHYKPLPLLTAYRNLGFSIAGFPNAAAMYEAEVTLPLYSTLSEDDARRVVSAVNDWISKENS